MKKLWFAFLTLLLLGGSLAWGQLRCTMGYAPGSSGAEVYFTALKEGTFKECSYFEDGGYFDISGLSSGDKITVWLSTKGSDDKHPNYGESYAPADWVFEENGENPLEFTYNGESEKSLLIRKKSAGGGGDPTVRGTVTVPGQSESFCMEGVVILSNDEKQFVSEVNPLSGGGYGYEFSDVPAGTYTLVGWKQPWGSTELYSGEKTVAVGSEDLTENLVLSLKAGTYYAVKIAALPPTGWTQVVGQLSVKNQSTGEIDKRLTEANNEYHTFFCKADVAYEIVIKANGYKTHKETQTFTYARNDAMSMLKIRMEEGQDENEAGNASLTGTVAVEGGGEWPSGVYIALTDASDNLISAASSLNDGTYTFTNVKLGSSVKLHLTTNLQNPASHPEDYTFVENGAEVNPVSFTMPADAGAEAKVTKNLTARYKGNATARLAGRVLEAGVCFSETGTVTVKLQKGGAYIDQTTTNTKPDIAHAQDWPSECKSIYYFDGVSAGTYTLTYTHRDYPEQTQEYTVAVTGAGQTVIAPDIIMSKEQVTLTLEVNDPAKGTVDGANTYDKGAQVSAWAHPYEGYEFVAWQDGTTRVTDENPYKFTIEANRTLTAIFSAKAPVVDPPVVEPEQVTLTLERNNAAWGTVDGANTYDKGASVTAKAVANEGYVFKGWQENGAIVSDKAEYTFIINTNRTLTAVFEAQQQTPPEPPVEEPEQVTLTLERNNAAWGTVEGAKTYDKGASVTAKAVPNEGYKFVEWQEGGETASTDAEYTFIINANRTLTAVFEAQQQTPPEPPVENPPVVEPEQVTLTLERNNPAWGTVEGAKTYDKGASATAKAVANEGYKFRAWTEGEEVVSMDAEYTFIINANRTLTAVFAEIPQPPVENPPVVKDSATLTLNANNADWGTVTGAAKYEKGAEVTAKAVPNEGYKFRVWTRAGVVVSMDAEYTFTLDADLTLTAVFAETETGGVKPTANEGVEQAAWSVHAENRTIVLRSETACRYDIYTVSGKKVGHGRSDGKEYRMTVHNGGLYVVRCTTANGVTTKKVAVR